MASANKVESPSEAAAADQRQFCFTFASPSFTLLASAAYPISMVKGNDEDIFEVAELTDTSTGDKRKRDAKMDEVKACANKLVKLINELASVVPLKASSAVDSPDYSLTAAIKCLNAMGDIIPESSTEYLNALDIIRDPVERECFLCLNPEPRRRWLQRMLLRFYPMHYSSEV